MGAGVIRMRSTASCFPAKAGIQSLRRNFWAPAFAGEQL
jgi:hypothetical protein